jgi:uncharacterized membrane protein
MTLCPDTPHHNDETAEASIYDHNANGCNGNRRRHQVATQSKRTSLVNFVLFHLPAVDVTHTLFGLYLAQFQWTANDTQINALLFAAKIHEALIAISLSNIIFHRIRYNMLTSDGSAPQGVPLGLLTAPLQISDPLYLCRKPFLACAKTMFASRTDFITILLVITTVIVATLSGPSSGVIMLPKLDWWPFPNNHPAANIFQQQNKGVMYLDGSFENLFPTKIKESMSLNLLWSSGFKNASFAASDEHPQWAKSSPCRRQTHVYCEYLGS